MRPPHRASRAIPQSLLLFLLCLCANVAFAEKCAAPPVPLPYVSISVSPGSFVHGIPVLFGEEGQRVALTPSLQLDTTFIPRYTNSCVHVDGMNMTSNDERQSEQRRSTDESSVLVWKRDGHPGSFEEDRGSEAGSGGKKGWEGRDWYVMCAKLYGGGFNPQLSSTFHDNGTNDQINEIWLKKINFEKWHFVTEQFAFADYATTYMETNEALPDKDKRNLTTTFILPDDGALFGGVGSSALGLTPDSKLLKALHTEDMVPSTSWSLTNDTLCLGCIDDAAKKGDFQMFDPADRTKDKGLPCLLQAKVEALNYHPKDDGEGTSLINEPFDACVDPGVTFVVLPANARKAFPSVVKRDLQSEFDDYMVLKGSPGNDVGILTFKLEGGLEINVTIPGAGDVSGGDGGIWRVPIGKGGWGAYGTDVAVLGRPFLESAVLKWDSKEKEFGIANANLDVGRKKDIKPLGCDSFPEVKRTVSTTPNIGVIVGSILGGFVSGLAFAAAGLFFFRRGEKGVKMKYRSMPSEEGLGLRHLSMDSRTIDSRMSGTLINSPPAPSHRDTFRSHFSSSHRSMSPGPLEPQLIPDNSIYEAPEGGTAYPSKRDALRTELTSYSPYHR